MSIPLSPPRSGRSTHSRNLASWRQKTVPGNWEQGLERTKASARTAEHGEVTSAVSPCQFGAGAEAEVVKHSMLIGMEGGTNVERVPSFLRSSSPSTLGP